MSTLSTTTAQRDHVGGILGMLAGVLTRWWVAHTTRRIQHLAIGQLNSMSDRELKDIGLSRSQIEFAVKGEHARDHVLSRYY